MWNLLFFLYNILQFQQKKYNITDDVVTTTCTYIQRNQTKKMFMYMQCRIVLLL